LSADMTLPLFARVVHEAVRYASDS
jgi:hypothetical protein